MFVGQPDAGIQARVAESTTLILYCLIQAEPLEAAPLKVTVPPNTTEADEIEKEVMVGLVVCAKEKMGRTSIIKTITNVRLRIMNLGTFCITLWTL